MEQRRKSEKGVTSSEHKVCSSGAQANKTALVQSVHHVFTAIAMASPRQLKCVFRLGNKMFLDEKKGQGGFAPPSV